MATLGVLGQALVDLIYSVNSDQIAALGLTVNSHQLIDTSKSSRIQNDLLSFPHAVVSGGSALNSLVAYALLGGKAGAFFRTGCDRFADLFKHELSLINARFVVKTDEVLPTGHSLILSDPAQGRAMATCLGAADIFRRNEVPTDFFTNHEALLLEGYMLAISGSEFLDCFRDANQSGKRTICTLSAPWIVNSQREKVLQALAFSSVVIANEEEASALTESTNPVENVKIIAGLLAKEREDPLVVITAGANGSYVGSSNVVEHVPAAPTTVKDLTGAGDAFAGAFLFSFLHGKTPIFAAREATLLASAVISQIGARATPEIIRGKA